MKQGDFYPGIIMKSDNSIHTTIFGYASVFGVIDSHHDVIVKGAFLLPIVHKVQLLWQHDQRMPIGIVKSLCEDEHGLKFEAEINNNIIVGKEVSELIKQGAVYGVSIGFTIKSFSYNEEGIRVIDELDLMEISIVTFPSNRKAQITYVKNQFLLNRARDIDINELSILTKKLQNIGGYYAG